MDLPLPHRLVLLSLDPETGGRRSMAPTSYAIAALAVAELVLAGRLDVVNDKVLVVNAEPTGQAVLDEAMAGVRNDVLRTPVARINRLRPVLEQATFTELVGAGLLVVSCADGPVSRTVLRIAEPGPVRALREKLRGGMAYDQQDLTLAMALRIAKLEHPVLGDGYRVLRGHAEELVEMGELPRTVVQVLRAGHGARAAMEAGLADRTATVG